MPYVDPLNEVVRDYQVSRAWEGRDAAAVAHAWFDIFNREFFDAALPTPVFSFGGTGRDKPACYRFDPDGAGVRHTITFHKGYQDGPRSAMLAVQLHAMVHEHEAHHFNKAGSQGNHRRDFQRMCDRIGIPCSEGRPCVTTAHTDPFMALLRRESVAVEHVGWGPKPGEPVLKKWGCGCQVVYATRRINVICGWCGKTLTEETRN